MKDIGYCRRRDKVQLSEADARHRAAGIGGMVAYRCDLCGHWHVATSGNGKHRRNKKGKLHGPEPHIFEVKTPDYDPNEMVPGIPPPDFTGNVRAWYDKVLWLVGFRSPPRGGTPMIRRADFCRLVADLEP